MGAGSRANGLFFCSFFKNDVSVLSLSFIIWILAVMKDFKYQVVTHTFGCAEDLGHFEWSDHPLPLIQKYFYLRHWCQMH